MAYLIPPDYKKQIQTDNLNQIIGGDTSVQAAAELAAQEEVTSYLTQKYDLAKEFKDLPAFDATKIYKAGDRVTSGGNIYFGTYPQPLFNYTALYRKGDQVFWKDKTYTCQVPTQPPTQDMLLQYQSYDQVPLNNVFPDDPVQGAKYWGNGTDYAISANATPDPAKWTAGDNRSQQMVMIMVDVALYHLHSRISPRNIPELRISRYHQAIDWLEKVAKGTITANLPVKQVYSGARIRFGGNVKRNNHY